MGAHSPAALAPRAAELEDAISVGLYGTLPAVLARTEIHPKVVRERLGHSTITISISLDTYSHVLPSMQRKAAGVVAALVCG